MNRGGGWDNDAANCRTANRNTNDPTNRTTNNGFRLALIPRVAKMALKSQPEQVVFPTGRMRIRPVKTDRGAARCW